MGIRGGPGEVVCPLQHEFGVGFLRVPRSDVFLVPESALHRLMTANVVHRRQVKQLQDVLASWSRDFGLRHTTIGVGLSWPVDIALLLVSGRWQAIGVSDSIVSAPRSRIRRYWKVLDEPDHRVELSASFDPGPFRVAASLIR